ncbi:MAG: hypothetical protein EOP35_07400 [Rubrivivax sp.]|nr:MAG: hypothetical protein EOP35_07400 [Rubrivivax sp.]
MEPQPLSTTRCLEAMSRRHDELMASLGELAITLRAAATTSARHELLAWCAFTAVVASGLTVVVILVLPVVRYTAA